MNTVCYLKKKGNNEKKMIKKGKRNLSQVCYQMTYMIYNISIIETEVGYKINHQL